MGQGWSARLRVYSAICGLALASASGGLLLGCDTAPPSPAPGPLGVGSPEDTQGTSGGVNDNDPVTFPPGEGSGTTLPMFTAGGSEQTTGSDTDGGSGETNSDTDPDETTGQDTDESTGGEPQVLPCDAGFSVSPLHPTTASFFVETTHEDPLAYVDLSVSGPNVAETSYVAVVDENPWRWRFEISGHIPGIYTIDFGNAPSEGGPVTVHSTCQIEVSAE